MTTAVLGGHVRRRDVPITAYRDQQQRSNCTTTSWSRRWRTPTRCCPTRQNVPRAGRRLGRWQPTAGVAYRSPPPPTPASASPNHLAHAQQRTGDKEARGEERLRAGAM
jgi:hypothetical protein